MLTPQGKPNASDPKNRQHPSLNSPFATRHGHTSSYPWSRTRQTTN